jgi:integrase
MSVYKRTKDSPYYDYDFVFRGDRFCGSCETANRRAAEKVEEGRRAEVKAEYECRKRAAGTALTVDGAFLRYWEEVGKYHKRSDQTMWSLKWLLESLGKDKRIRDITNNDVAHLVARRRGEPVNNVAAALDRRRGNHHVKPPKLVSPARVNRSVTEPLRKILLRARDVWGEEISPIAWKKHRLKEPQERVRELKGDEEAKLFKALPTQYHKIVRFALLTACRLSECVMLEWPAVDWGGRTVTIFGKGDKLAPIPMSVGIRDLLWSLQGAHKKRVFVRASGDPISISGLDTAFGRALTKAGIEDFRFHDLRHTTATRLLRHKGNMRMVQKLLRHSDIATTARYAHVLDEDLRNALDEIEAPSPAKSPADCSNYLK